MSGFHVKKFRMSDSAQTECCKQSHICRTLTSSPPLNILSRMRRETNVLFVCWRILRMPRCLGNFARVRHWWTLFAACHFCVRTKELLRLDLLRGGCTSFACSEV